MMSADDNRTRGSAYSVRPALPWRFLLWLAAGALLLLPLFAMQFTTEVSWDGLDFAVFGGMLIFAGAAVEFVVWAGGSRLVRLFGAGAVVIAFVAIWATLAIDAI